MKIKQGHRKHLEWAMNRFDSAFYCYDLDGLKEHLKALKDQTPNGVKLWYACKANPLSSILKEFRDQGFGVDIASMGELNHVLNLGLDHQEIIATGPAKSKSYLKELIESGVKYFVVESQNQLLWLEELAREFDHPAKALLRVRLPFGEGTSVLGGNEVTPFGIEPGTWREFNFKQIEKTDILGFHCFQWGNILDPNRLKEIWWTIGHQLQELSQELGIPMKVLDLGGGLGLDYEEHQEELAIDTIMNLLKELQQEFSVDEIWMELGRYAVGNHGVYATKVIDHKRSGDRNLLVTDGGINHLARAALTGQSFPATLFRESDENNKTYYIHGPLCTSLDKQGHFQLPEDLTVDDWVIFHKCGAYGFTESMPFFLCHNLPAEIIIKDDGREVIRTVKPATEWLL